MCPVADGHGALLFDIAQEWSFVVGQEVEDSVVVRDGESDTVDTFRLGRGALGWLQLQTVEGGQHTELELQLILIRDLEVPPAVPDPLGQRDGIGLELIVSQFHNHKVPSTKSLQCSV